MLPNVAYAFGLVLPFADQVWSIGVEEQFYVIWPFIIRNKKPFFGIILVLVLYLISRIATQYLASEYHSASWKSLNFLITVSNFGGMAIGGLIAFFLFEQRKFLKFFYLKSVQIIFVLLLVSFLLSGTNFGFLNFEIYCVFFGLLVLNLAANPKTLINLEYRPLNYLGKISFGLYMYHFIAIRLAEIIFRHSPIQVKGLQLATIFGLTIVISSISYEYFEKKFLIRKAQFAVIKSE